MVARPARVVAKAYGQAGRAIRRPVSANPGGSLANQLGPGIFPPGSKAIGSDVPGVCPSPIAFALTKTCSGRMVQFNPEGLSAGDTAVTVVFRQANVVSVASFS